MAHLTEAATAEGFDVYAAPETATLLMNCGFQFPGPDDPRVDEKLKEEYMDELLVMSQLDPPNIVAVKGACLAPPDLCIVEELVEGGSLHAYLHGPGARRVPAGARRGRRRRWSRAGCPNVQR